MVEHDESTRKTIRFNEVSDKEQDYLSLLPDELLIDIISRLRTTKEAIRTGTLAKRWQHLWPSVSNLVFNDYNDPLFTNFVDKTLTQCHQSSLHKFQISSSYGDKFESQVNNWIRYAVSRNVQDLRLYVFEFVLDEFMFINSCFTRLELERCKFYHTCAISWTNLKSLSISRVKNFFEDSIQNILSGSPLLETLELKYCYGFERIDITSKSVKKFVFSGYLNHEEDYSEGTEDEIAINAPYIVSLTIVDALWLSRLLLVDVSCVVKAHLDYEKYGHYEPTSDVSREETLEGLILCLLHVKKLRIGGSCLEALAGLKAKGFICPANLKVTEEIEAY